MSFANVVAAPDTAIRGGDWASTPSTIADTTPLTSSKCALAKPPLKRADVVARSYRGCRVILVAYCLSQVRLRAGVAELADALASGASPGNRVEVRVLSSAPFDSPIGSPPASRRLAHGRPPSVSRMVVLSEQSAGRRPDELRVEGHHSHSHTPSIGTKTMASSSDAVRPHPPMRRRVVLCRQDK